jgi:signal peptidase I
MNGESHQRKHIDLRIALYRALKQFVLILAVGWLLQYALCDTVLIRTDQMEPTILRGDRVLLLKTSTAAPFKWFINLRHRDLVVFRHPHLTGKNCCLRVAGIPGDTVTVVRGSLTITNRPDLTFVKKQDEEETLPPEFSPRDNLAPLRIPQKGDTVDSDSLSMRDLIFFYSMIQQENPKKKYTLRPTLVIDDSITNDYIIKDFPLYAGVFSAIPDSLFTDWFFWDRLNAYLTTSHTESRVLLTFSLLEDQFLVDRYVIKKRYYFLLSDTWCRGYDSRYFGPVAANTVKGKVIGILWSFSGDRPGIKGLRGRRIFKIIT